MPLRARKVHDQMVFRQLPSGGEVLNYKMDVPIGLSDVDGIGSGSGTSKSTVPGEHLSLTKCKIRIKHSFHASNQITFKLLGVLVHFSPSFSSSDGHSLRTLTAKNDGTSGSTSHRNGYLPSNLSS